MDPNVKIIKNTRGGKYYTFNGQKYDIHFPLLWAIDDYEEDKNGIYGTFNCARCEDNGKINGVYIGYCKKCAEQRYNFTRGNGFTSPGVEQRCNYMFDFNSPFKNANSVWNTYLKDVNINRVGIDENEFAASKKNKSKSKNYEYDTDEQEDGEDSDSYSEYSQDEHGEEGYDDSMTEDQKYIIWHNRKQEYENAKKMKSRNLGR